MNRRETCRDLGLRQPILRILSGLDQTTVNEWLGSRSVGRDSAQRLGTCLQAAQLARTADAAAMRVGHYAYGGKVVTAYADEPLPRALEQMFLRGLSNLPVIDAHGKMQGSLSIAHVAERVGKGELRALRRARVREAMVLPRKLDDAPLDAELPLVEAAALAADDRARLVQRNGELTGIFTATDAVKPVFLAAGLDWPR